MEGYLPYHKAFFYWVLLAIAALMNVCGVSLVKLEINKISERLLLNSFGQVWQLFQSLLNSPTAVLGAVLAFVAPFPVAVVLSKIDVSIAYPVLVGLTCLLLLPLAMIFLGESLSKEKIIGTCLVIVGLYFLCKQSV